MKDISYWSSVHIRIMCAHVAQVLIQLTLSTNKKTMHKNWNKLDLDWIAQVTTTLIFSTVAAKK